jgi:hypothetical protein
MSVSVHDSYLCVAYLRDEYKKSVWLHRRVITPSSIIAMAAQRTTTAMTTPDRDSVLAMSMSNATLSPEHLAQAGKSALNHGDSTRWTALLWATRNDHVDNVKALLAAGADPNIATLYGRSPLVEALEKQLWDIAHVLIQGGANANDHAPGGDPVLVLAVQFRAPIDLIKALVDAGADLEAQARSSVPKTARERAVAVAYPEAAEYLETAWLSRHTLKVAKFLA